HQREPDFGLIKSLAAECRMPLCYGGGVKTVEQVERIVALGVEKIAISSAAVHNPQLISSAAAAVGCQSIVVVMDVKRKASNDHELRIHNGRERIDIAPVEFAKLAEQHGAGELVINSIDRDGMMNGYDLQIASEVRSAVNLPITVLGGAGSLRDIAGLI